VWRPVRAGGRIYQYAGRRGGEQAGELAGDAASSRKAYQDFFAIWKDADPDAPQLVQAKAENAKLK